MGISRCAPSFLAFPCRLRHAAPFCTLGRGRRNPPDALDRRRQVQCAGSLASVTRVTRYRREARRRARARYRYGRRFGIHVCRDISGDGRDDIFTSSARDYGIFWLDQGADGHFTKHNVDYTWWEAQAWRWRICAAAMRFAEAGSGSSFSYVGPGRTRWHRMYTSMLYA